MGHPTVAAGAVRARRGRAWSSWRWCVWLSLKYSLGIDLVARVLQLPRDALTTRVFGPVPDQVESSALRAISSAGERFVHTEEVTGSIPVSPTVHICRSEARYRNAGNGLLPSCPLIWEQIGSRRLARRCGPCVCRKVACGWERLGRSSGKSPCLTVPGASASFAWYAGCRLRSRAPCWFLAYGDDHSTDRRLSYVETWRPYCVGLDPADVTGGRSTRSSFSCW